MEQRRCQHRHQPQPKRPDGGRAGFTLIEVMVVIAVMGALSAAIIVNWSSFIRHQELRQDAVALHKEIMALKARAIEQDSVAMITFAKSNATSYTIRWVVRNDDDAGTVRPAKKDIAFNGNVVISTASADRAGTDLPSVGTNNWVKESAPNDSIIAQPNNLETFEDGWIVVKSNKANAVYCIQKDVTTGIRPEIWYKSNKNKANGKWTRM